MNIKTIVIAGQRGDIEITRNDDGAYVMEGEVCIAAFKRDDDRDARYAKAAEVAKAVYGTDRRGRAAATNSMIHDVLYEIERVAGC
ncbi:MAG: hypothetical protein HRU76_01095 [Phycisphaeraceae bacterium]|nr:MAG: hypothetical protein HRU76_01095 [Phycisphaeraceae bacterium]